MHDRKAPESADLMPLEQVVLWLREPRSFTTHGSRAAGESARQWLLYYMGCEERARKMMAGHSRSIAGAHYRHAARLILNEPIVPPVMGPGEGTPAA